MGIDFEWKKDSAQDILENIQKAVEHIRSGAVGINPYAIDCRTLLKDRKEIIHIKDEIKNDNQ